MSRRLLLPLIATVMLTLIAVYFAWAGKKLSLGEMPDMDSSMVMEPPSSSTTSLP